MELTDYTHEEEKRRERAFSEVLRKGDGRCVAVLMFLLASTAFPSDRTYLPDEIARSLDMPLENVTYVLDEFRKAGIVEEVDGKWLFRNGMTKNTDK